MAENKHDGSEFILKLTDMMMIVGWNQDCTEIVIKNLQMMTEEVLPKYFRHKKFESFVRQLNMYNFHKVCREQNNLIIFKNEQFYKGNEANFSKIRRKRKNELRLKAPESIEDSTKFIDDYPSLDFNLKKLLEMLINFKNAADIQARKSSYFLQKVSCQLKGNKYKKVEATITDLKNTLEDIDKKTDDIDKFLFFLNTPKVETSTSITEARPDHNPFISPVDIPVLQATMNSYLENTPITNTLIDAVKVKKVELENFKSTFNLHSFRSITSFIDICCPIKAEQVSEGQDDDMKSVDFQRALNEKKYQYFNS